MIGPKVKVAGLAVKVACLAVKIGPKVKVACLAVKIASLAIKI